MTAALLMNEYQVQALVVCLAASLVWAPVALLAAHRIARNADKRTAQAIWIAALLLAIAPSALALGLAGLGLSLRTATTASLAEIAPSWAPSWLDAPSTLQAEPAPLAGAAEPFATPDGAESAVAPPAATRAASARPDRDARQAAAATSVPGSIDTFAGNAMRAAPPEAEPQFAEARPMSAMDASRAIVIIYAYGVVLALMIWAGRAMSLTLVAAAAAPVRDRSLVEGVENWRARLGVTASPRLLRSRQVSSVCVFGLLRPVVLIPNDIETRVSDAEIVMMCAHELAHIRRRDTQLFFATAFVRSLFWFNPFVRAITLQVEQCAEEAADAQVIARGVDRRDYAACFVKSLRFAAERNARPPVFTPTFTPIERNGRRKRLEAILSDAGAGRIRMSGRAAAGGLGLAMIGAAVAQAGLAVSPSSIENRPEFVAQLTRAFAGVERDGGSPVIALADIEAPFVEDTEAVANVREQDAKWDIAASPADGVEPVVKAPAPPAPPAAIAEPGEAFVVPASGRISLAFGEKTPFGDVRHSGLDIAAREGDAVLAARAGRVLFVDANGKGAIGKYIKIDHGDGLYTNYTHLSRVDVAAGDKIRAGQPIAAVGSTGRATGPHLHFEVIRAGVRVDPMSVLPPGFAFASQPSPSTPSLKGEAQESQRSFRHAQLSDKPVRLALSSPNKATEERYELAFDASGRQIAGSLEATLLQDAVVAARRNGSDPKPDRTRQAFARMEAELAEARAKRARISEGRSDREDMDDRASAAVGAREEARIGRMTAQARVQAKAAAAAARAEAAREHARLEEMHEAIASQFCCGRFDELVDDLTAQIETTIETAFDRMTDDVSVEIHQEKFAADALAISRMAIEAARASLAEAELEGGEPLAESARRKIADQEAEIRRLRAELEAARRKD